MEMIFIMLRWSNRPRPSLRDYELRLRTADCDLYDPVHGSRAEIGHDKNDNCDDIDPGLCKGSVPTGLGHCGAFSLLDITSILLPL